MKKYALILFTVFSIIMIAGLTAVAQSATPAPGAPAPDQGSILLSLFGIVSSWKSLGIYGGIAAILKLLIDATKAFGVFDKIPAKFQGLFVVLIGFLVVGVTTLASGGTLVEAVAAAFGSSSGAMLLHEILQDLFPPKASA